MMQIKKSIFTAGVIAFFMASISACKKEGCTDSYATNYDKEAGADNGTCRYSGSIQFWYDKSASEIMNLTDVTSLKFFVDGEAVGTKLPSDYFATEPDCGVNLAVNKKIDLGLETSKKINYKVTDQDDFVLWQDTLSLEGNKPCLSVKLEY